MKKHFFITGYPRSRTCWAANLLSTAEAFCYHDGLVGLDRLEDLREQLERPAVPVVGLSDPAILLYWETLAEWYPDARWVVIERDPESAYRSAVQAFGVFQKEFFQMLERAMCDLITHLRPLVVDFEKITPEVALGMGRYVGVDVGCIERVQQLCFSNVQLHDLRGRIKQSCRQSRIFVLSN